MKKFLTAISLMLVALMVFAVPAVAAEDVYDTLEVPEGINVYYATDVTGSEPMLDGVIEDGEYGEAYRVSDPFVASNSNWGSGAPKDGETTYPEFASEYFDVYFAYDKENFYIAIKDVGPAYVDDGDEFATNNVPFRNNYRFQFGFEPDNALNYFQCDGYTSNGAWPAFTYFENGTKRDNAPNKTYDFAELMMTKYALDTPDTPIAMGDLLSANGNANYTAAQWGVTMEYKFNKADLAEVWNNCYATEYNDVANAMWFGFTTNAFKANGTYRVNDDGSFKLDGEGNKMENLEPCTNQYFNWFGINDITGEDFSDYGVPETKTQLFDLIVFGEEGDDIILADPYPVIEDTQPEETEPEETEPEDTQPAESQPEETEPEETEPEDTQPAESQPEGTDPETTEPEVTTEAEEDDEDEDTTKKEETKAPETTEKVEEKKGCGSSVGVAGLALVAALGTCTVFVAKKKED